jgi:hydroxymethylglutaryl-CoA reductase
MIDPIVHFLKHELIPLLRTLPPGQKPKWGKMDAQQMVEHMRDVFKAANGKIVLPLLNTDPERLAKMRTFLLTDQQFHENTKSAVMPEEPRPHKYKNIEEAITKLEPEVEDVFNAYAPDHAKLLMHPAFGELDYELQIRYLDKHVRHHLRQFGLVD